MTVLTCKTFALACAFAARFCVPGGNKPAAQHVHLEFRFGELFVWGGDGHHFGYARLAVPAAAYCDVSASLQHVATMQLNAGPDPVTLLQLPDGTVRAAGLGVFEPRERPERTDWYQRLMDDPSHVPGVTQVYGRTFGEACLGLLTLGNFPSMNNPVKLDKRLRHIRLTPTDQLRDGIIEAGAIVECVA